MIHLIKHEFFIQNRIYNLIKYFFIFFVFGSGSIVIISTYDQITSFGISFSLVSVPLALISVTTGFLKSEIESGSLETLLTIFHPIQIISAKYLSLLTCSSISFLTNIPILYLLFNIAANQLSSLIISGLLLIFTSCAMVILISSIQCYFRSNTTFLSAILLPLVIPGIALAGIIIQNNNNYSLALIFVGVNCIIVPASIYSSSYLLENIYNI